MHRLTKLRLPRVTSNAGSLGILADYALSGIGNLLGKVAHGVSLDNTIRIAHLAPTDWVQCDITKSHIRVDLDKEPRI
jgi:hypothetical protein